MKKYLGLGILCLVLHSCVLEDKETLSDSAMGEAGDVAIFSDEAGWNDYGDLVDSVFMKRLPGMPNHEPYFRVRRCNETMFSGLYKKNYNLLILIHGENWPTLKSLFSTGTQEHIRTILAGDEIKLLVDEDKWARPQVVHYIIAPRLFQLKNELRSNGEFYLYRLLDAERKATVSSLIHQREKFDTFYNNRLEERGYAIRKTDQYRLSVLSDSFIGLSRYIADRFQGSYLFAEDYIDQGQFSTEYIVQKHNQILGKHVQGSDHPDGLPTYMAIDEKVPLGRRVMKLNGRYAVETRGWWEMVNEFKGGPFVSYTIHCPEINKVVTIEGVVFAPGRGKAKMLRQLELILSTFEVKK